MEIFLKKGQNLTMESVPLIFWEVFKTHFRGGRESLIKKVNGYKTNIPQNYPEMMKKLKIRNIKVTQVIFMSKKIFFVKSVISCYTNILNLAHS